MKRWLNQLNLYIFSTLPSISHWTRYNTHIHAYSMIIIIVSCTIETSSLSVIRLNLSVFHVISYLLCIYFANVKKYGHTNTHIKFRIIHIFSALRNLNFILTKWNKYKHTSYTNACTQFQWYGKLPLGQKRACTRLPVQFAQIGLTFGVWWRYLPQIISKSKEKKHRNKFIWLKSLIIPLECIHTRDKKKTFQYHSLSIWFI